MRRALIVALAVLAAPALAAPGLVSAESSERRTGGPEAAQDVYTSVIASAIGSPTFPFKGTDGKYHVAYDLEVQNASTVPATLLKVDVVDGARPSRVVASYEGDVLVSRLRGLTQAQHESNSFIEPNGGRILFSDFAFDSLRQAPKTVKHHVYALGAVEPPAREATPIDYTIAPYDISAGTPRVIAPPVKGTGWVAFNGCCEPHFPHRTSPAPINGRIANAQRYALDWKRMNDQGMFFTGDDTKNESYVDYGTDVLAVADGTVVETFGEMEANAPGMLPAEDPARAASLTPQNVDGNYVVLDIGGNVFAVYAHLEQGSLKVKKGEKVKVGQKLARLGNTGNANASHLHFHLMNGPRVLGSDGVPYVIDSFQYDGQVDVELISNADEFLSGQFGEGRLAEPQPRVDELPLAFAIVNFPS